MHERPECLPGRECCVRERFDAARTDGVERRQWNAFAADASASRVGCMRGAQVESDIAEASVLDVQPQRHVLFVEPLENFGTDRVEPQLDSRVLPAKGEGGRIDAEIRERIDPVPHVHAAGS